MRHRQFGTLAFGLALAASAACGAQPGVGERPDLARSSPSHTRQLSLEDVGLDASILDRSASPCDDFYQFACGSWLETTTLPEDRAVWKRSFGSMERAVARNLRTMLEDFANQLGAPQPPVERMLGTFYASCMDTTAIDGAGIAPIRPMLAHIDRATSLDVSQDICSLRIGAKYDVTSGVAVTGGQAAGFHAAGTYVSPDVGVITGFENRYVVPFHSERVLVSIPLRSRAVDTTSGGDAPGTHVGRPELTGGFQTAFGLRVPIPPSFEPKTGVRGSIVGGIGTTWLNDGEDDSFLLAAGGGGEIEF